MLRSEFDNLLSVAEWVKLMGLNPWRVAGFCTNVPGRYDTNCAGVWGEYTYQNDALAVQDVSSAIAQAEHLFAQSLGFFPAPRYVVNESHRYPPGSYPYNQRGQLKNAQLEYGHVIAFGVEVCDLLGETPVSRISLYNEQIEISAGSFEPVLDSFEATITVPEGTEPSEIHAYFTDTDRDDADHCKFEVRPLRVTVEGTTATLRGAAYLISKPELHLGAASPCLDVLQVDHYVSEIEVRRCRLVDCPQGYLVWEQVGMCGDEPCQELLQPVCWSLRDVGCGVAYPTPALEEDGVCTITNQGLAKGRRPDRVRANYLSGCTEDGCTMPSWSKQAVAFLAASLLDCSICACGCTKERLEAYVDYPKVKTAEGTEQGLTGDQWRLVLDEQRDAGNPFGLKVGALKAWRLSEPHTICQEVASLNV